MLTHSALRWDHLKGGDHNTIHTPLPTNSRPGTGPSILISVFCFFFFLSLSLRPTHSLSSQTQGGGKLARAGIHLHSPELCQLVTLPKRPFALCVNNKSHRLPKASAQDLDYFT